MATSTWSFETMPTLRTRVSKPTRVTAKKRRKTAMTTTTRRNQRTKKSKKRPSRVTDGELKRRYRDTEQPGSLGGAARFAKAQGISLRRAKRILAHELGYTLHKPTRRHFPTLRVMVFGPDEQWAADLIDLQKLKRENKGTNYLLTVVDVFSKYAWVVPIKQKTGPQVAQALATLFKTNKRSPQKLQTDDGKEFYNKHVTKVLKDHDVHHFSTSGDTKASVVERFNRTFKERLYRYMTTYNTLKYLSSLPKLVDGYNASFHRSIGKAPRDVDQNNAEEVWDTLYGDKKKKKKKKSAFKVGDRVRLNKKHRTFDKGYLPGWTEEVFLITQARLDGNVPTYRISEWDDTPIKGTFYAEDLQKVTVTDDDLFRIDSVVRRKKDSLLVRWKGWPAKYDSWIDKKDLVPLSK